ncbi:unnamed protein product (macronuclear) [Paramecium tetraurelia]|uniref:Chromosome undetermined scaffold_141, whole genome shotgun sequence n=1 Tax=Paramecium tetraurelia TaxID=5888 RepID=A0C1F1_PARTE|nr:uncharacterized protein GSPATT00034094001 [Paramecium tetraurelia]XP_001440597.1 uncharacterized protein GSPATT00038856001 [Paramecium tetraurelia]CAK64618.1 unnamed protein product [Paramecium tetraurelia]CAK73200.1 unnamed protein product [Paramecium tetraurelia]|eukprot:XP_001432016.1 hypothetical protein (macronuclear) [Paramecium tetraurelia strain d4-2]
MLYQIISFCLIFKARISQQLNLIVIQQFTELYRLFNQKIEVACKCYLIESNPIIVINGKKFFLKNRIYTRNAYKYLDLFELRKRIIKSLSQSMNYFLQIMMNYKDVKSQKFIIKKIKQKLLKQNLNLYCEFIMQYEQQYQNVMKNATTIRADMYLIMNIQIQYFSTSKSLLPLSLYNSNSIRLKYIMGSITFWIRLNKLSKG